MGMDLRTCIVDSLTPLTRCVSKLEVSGGLIFDPKKIPTDQDVYQRAHVALQRINDEWVLQNVLTLHTCTEGHSYALIDGQHHNCPHCLQHQLDTLRANHYG